MGWRDRDYAKWTPEERGRFLGGSRHDRANRHRPVIIGGAGVAAAISLGLLVLSQAPSGRAVISALHLRIGPRSTARLVPAPLRSAPLPLIAGPTVVQAGTSAHYRGRAPRGSGDRVVIRGSMDRGAWETLAVADGSRGYYDATIAFATPGVLVLHAQFPDGEVAAWTVHVLPAPGTPI